MHSCRCSAEVCKRLHAAITELVEFCRFLAPSTSELASRQAALGRVTDAVQSIWPSASVQVFGSFVTGARSSIPKPLASMSAPIIKPWRCLSPDNLRQSAVRTLLGKDCLIPAVNMPRATVPQVDFLLRPRFSA